MHRIIYKLFDEYLILITDNDEMHAYLEDVLEKHIITDTEFHSKITIFIPWLANEKRRYLTRTSPSESEILTDVLISYKTQNFMPWSNIAPPLIPYILPNIVGRFFAYHASAINVLGFGALIFLGNKGSGKTTNSLALCKEQNHQLLTDETCVIDKSSMLIKAMLRQPHGHIKISDSKPTKGILKFRENSWIKTTDEAPPKMSFELVFIPGLRTPHIQNVQNKNTATQIYLRHQLHFGSTANEHIDFSRELAKRVPLYQIHHGGYESFAMLRHLILEQIERNTI